MFKKLASIALAATMLVGTAGIAASAAEVKDDSAVAAEDQSAVGAQDSDSVGADSESSSVGSGNVINFDASTTDWQNYKYCMCYIYEIGGDEFFDWGVKKTRMKDEDKDNVWTYDLDNAGISLDSGKYYAVIFSNDVGMQTADLILTTDCYGDTAYIKDLSARYENTADSNKQSYVAYWKNNTQWKPHMAVTSIGNVIGEQLAPSESAYSIFVSFLKDTLANAKEFSGKDDQTLIDDTAKALGIGQDLIPQAIEEAGVTVDWKADNSTAEKESKGDVKQTGGSGSGSGSKSVSSGQETTIFYILGGVMVAAAGVVFLSRKRKMN
ncbi:MAG: LPXTG cell wall anchor domain-containing protein [Clostridia bacterium]|nr:LPXTG cell wall anchor domain-containing protein [Clostridia bacterium]